MINFVKNHQDGDVQLLSFWGKVITLQVYVVGRPLGDLSVFYILAPTRILVDNHAEDQLSQILYLMM